MRMRQLSVIIRVAGVAVAYICKPPEIMQTQTDIRLKVQAPYSSEATLKICFHLQTGAKECLSILWLFQL